jgi:hypothetical protein
MEPILKGYIDCLASPSTQEIKKLYLMKLYASISKVSPAVFDGRRETALKISSILF